nr:hypothetical protein L203_01417 [Cryptococcus depauperatus CBS 7841]
MSSLQAGSSDGSHGLTPHGPSQSHLPAPSTSSQTRKWRRITKFNPSAIPTERENLPQYSATNTDWHNDGTGKGNSRPQDGYKTASAYLKERGCPTLRTPSGIRSKGQYIIDHAPIDRHVGAEKDAMGEQVTNTISNPSCSAGLLVDDV